MSPVNDFSQTHVFDLMGMALTVGKGRIEELVAREPEKLRGSHLRVLSLIPADGIRPTELAGVAGMTKQSLGEFVDALQRIGCVEVVVDPADRRARIVTPTPKGRKLQDRVAEVFAEIEREWSTAVGPRQWATFRKVLTHLAAQRLIR
jgi:DNA-binding MarR family transcriptional regulator